MPIPQKLLHPIPCSAITTKSTLWKKKVKITAYSRSATVHSWLSFFFAISSKFYPFSHSYKYQGESPEIPFLAAHSSF